MCVREEHPEENENASKADNREQPGVLDERLQYSDRDTHGLVVAFQSVLAGRENGLVRVDTAT